MAGGARCCPRSLAEKRAEVLDAYDINDNGVLDDGEHVTLRQDRVAAARERRAELMET